MSMRILNYSPFVFLILFLHLITTIPPVTSHEMLGYDYETIVLTENYNTNRTVAVDANKEYIVRYPDSQSKNPYTVYAWSRQVFFEHPVFIVVRQRREVTSWQIPLTVSTTSVPLKFLATSRTLCHDNMDLINQMPRSTSHDHEFSGNINGLHKELSISLSTSSKIPAMIDLRVEEQDQFYIEENIDYSVTISPSEPRFFYYKFSDQDEDDILSTVILEVDSGDDVCLTVSIQNSTCPVSDLNEEIKYTGKHQTVSNRGGIIIKRREFPNGFFVVFVAKGDNFDCTRENSIIPLPKTQLIRPLNRSTNVSFNIKASISMEDYLIASLSTLAVFFVFYIIVLLLSCVFYRWASTYTGNSSNSEGEVAENSELPLQNLDRNLVPTGARDEIDAALASTDLMLCDLAKKQGDHFERKANAYLWHVLSIAIFYGIPVVQLVVTYQRIVNVSGNQDICYYNFLCAYPLFGFSDFNHIYSNVGYILAGILFLIVIFYRNRAVVHSDRCGIPKHHGLFYAMGVALIMEGILSGCYHICPNQSNFQFDTSFMYVMAVLCLVKLYQNRHPDINATAYSTFLVLGFAIFAAMIGVLNGHLALWILFIISYILLCFYVSFNIYFLSYVKRGFLGVVDEWHTEHSFLRFIEPKRKAHFALLLVGNILNIVMASLGILCYYTGTDFATYLLGLLMGNAILYATIYIIMKIIHKERICMQAAIFGILGLSTWMGATYFFVNNSTEWTVTAAESREWNRHCILLNFYDHHDIWHLLSAPALFFSFMLLLCLDDDLVRIPYERIAVF